MCHDTGCPIPYGYCHCGCGEMAAISPITDRARGWRRGVPRTFKHGHNVYKHHVLDAPTFVSDPTLVAAGGYTPRELARFWLHVHKTESCWICDLTPSAPYPYIVIAGVRDGAHRVSYRIHSGPIPKGMDVAHNCPGGDNKRCVNPAHLLVLTRREHGRDQMQKGQIPTGDQSFPHLHPERLRRGEGTTTSKLTEEQVRRIRALYTGGAESRRQLAAVFGVHSSTIYVIAMRKIWKHVS